MVITNHCYVVCVSSQVVGRVFLFFSFGVISLLYTAREACPGGSYLGEGTGPLRYMAAHHPPALFSNLNRGHDACAFSPKLAGANFTMHWGLKPVT